MKKRNLNLKEVKEKNDFLPIGYQIPETKMKPIIQRKYPKSGSKSCEIFFLRLEELHNLIDYFYFSFQEHIYSNFGIDSETGEYPEDEKKVLKEFDSHFEILDQLVYSKAVDGFENYFIQIAKEILKSCGDTLEFELKFSVPINRINSEYLTDEINDQVDNGILERYSGNKKDLCSKISKDFKISRLDDSTHKDIERIFQIRNLFTHTNGIINKEYNQLSEFIANKGLSIGNKLVLSKEEVQNDLSLITTVITHFDKEIIDKYKLAKHKIKQSESFDPVYR